MVYSPFYIPKMTNDRHSRCVYSISGVGGGCCQKIPQSQEAETWFVAVFVDSVH